jgi:predicted TIM-barrel enzyme
MKVVCHPALATGGPIGAETAVGLSECVPLIDDWGEAGVEVQQAVIIVCRGSPIAMPEDASYILANSRRCHGVYGASSRQWLPVEAGPTEQTRRFTAIGSKRTAGPARARRAS